MKITFLTLFKDTIENFKNYSIIKNAIRNSKLELEFIDLREFSIKGNVDDTLFGGGAGMLLRVDVVHQALKSVREKNSKVFLLSPSGTIHNQTNAKKLSKYEHIIFICGHYEGIDSRIKEFIDGELSIGNYIVTGGELPALIITETIIRLIPGVIKEESHQKESFEKGLIECNSYTQPRVYLNLKVPNILLSGNHKKINDWKINSSIENTLKYFKDNNKF